MLISRMYKVYAAVFAISIAAVFADKLPLYTPKLDSLTNTTVEYRVPPYFLADYASQWKALEYALMYNKDRHVILLWNGNGGLVDMGEDFIRYVHTAEKEGKTVQLLITNTAISMHAMVVCAASSYVMTKNATIHFHAEFERVSDNSPKVYVDSPKRWTECEAKGILSSEEVNIIVNEHRRIVILGNGDHVITNDWAMAPYVAKIVSDHVATVVGGDE